VADVTIEAVSSISPAVAVRVEELRLKLEVVTASSFRFLIRTAAAATVSLLGSSLARRRMLRRLPSSRS
jgi:hypothetical protein